MKFKLLIPIACVGLLICLAACGAETNPPAASKDNTATPSNDISSPATEPSDAEPSEPAAEALPDVNGIPGSYMGDVMAALKEKGSLPIGAISRADGREGFYTSSTITESTTGVTFSYNISCDEDYQIFAAIFDISGGELYNTPEFKNLAASFLAYCSSLNYDTADASTTQAWVNDNFDDIANAPETTVGDATFRLETFADTYSLIAEVSDYNEQSANLSS